MNSSLGWSNCFRFKESKLFNEIYQENDSTLASFRETMADNIAEDDTAKTILQTLKLSIVQPELPADMDCVRIMSLHKSKGLTADYVFVLGCIERLLPAYSSAESQSERLRDLEEQRRLFYVAITRVRRFLLLSNTEQLSMRDVNSMNMGFTTSKYVFYTSATRFLKELGPLCPPSVSGKEFLARFLNS